MATRSGTCLCGGVRYQVSGEPERIGICHCMDCRKESGSAFTTFAIWPRSAFVCAAEVSTHDGRSFCPTCGSRLFALTDDAVEIKVGSLDMAPSELEPTYELWVKRREGWLPPLPGAEQFDEDRI